MMVVKRIQFRLCFNFLCIKCVLLNNFSVLANFILSLNNILMIFSGINPLFSKRENSIAYTIQVINNCITYYF